MSIDVNKIYCGNTLDVLRTFPDESISCCVTSPPYWALRDYGTDGVVWDGDPDCEHEFELETKHTNNAVSDKSTLHDGLRVKDTEKIKQMNDKSQVGFCQKCGAWKGQLGLEPDFNLYIKHLCDIFDEVKRVLRKDGTCWVNLGDTYGGTGDKGECKDPKYPEGRNGQQKALNRTVMQKSLCNIPSRFSIEMQNRGWILRNKIIWHKPNCMPSSVTDRFTVDFEEIFFFTKNKKYWFEQQLVPYTEPMNRWGGESLKRDTSKTKEYKDIQKIGNSSAFRVGMTMRPNEQGKNMRTVWKIPTQPFPDAHFAVFPEKLVETPIKAGCPKDICTKCGKPREKIKVPIGEFEFDEIDYYNDTDKSKPYSVVPREGYVPVRQLPDIHKLKVYLQDARKNAGYTIDEVEEIMDSQAPHHWFNGEAYPTVEDWGRIKELLKFDGTYDKAMTEVKYKPAEKCQTKYKEKYTKCDCNAPFVPGIVLDPFMGSGTVALKALKENRRFVGIEINPKYIDMANERIRPLLSQSKLFEEELICRV